MQRVRGNDIAMIFQEPMTSLNPVYSVGDQIGEALRKHRGLNQERTRAETIQLLELVGMPDPEQRIDEYPHQLSGGMRQRVMIAMALSCRPRLLIADEPTTALDVTVQAQILELMADLQKRLRMAVLLITHDLGVVAANAHRVAVMYAGRVVETASVYDLFEEPGHPYTAGLLNSLPQLDHRGHLVPIAGNVPDVLSLPPGCPFHPRCQFRVDRCSEERPELLELRGKRATRAACFVTQDTPELDLRKAMVRKALSSQSSEGAT
jgi:oligopeptide/dipeptide ABC transporter ATP-binding protein